MTKIDKFILKYKDNWFGYTLLILTCIFAFLWILNTPLYFDDYIYQRKFQPDVSPDYWALDSGFIKDFDDVALTIKNHFLYINGRLANIAYLCMQLTPVWVIKLVCAIVMVCFCLSLWRSIGFRYLNKPLLSVIYIILFWGSFQWSDAMQSSDFQFNYLVSGLFLTILLTQFVLRSKSPKPIYWLLLLLFAVWHEGFALILFIFLIVYACFYNKKYLWIAASILLVGLIAQLFSGTSNRIHGSEIISSMPYGGWYIMIIKSWSSILAIFLWFFYRRKIDKKVLRTVDAFFCAFILSWIVMIFLTFKYHFPQRAHWPNDICAFILIFLMVKDLCHVRIRKIFIVFLILYVFWGVSLLYYQIRVKKFSDYCIEQLQQGNNIILDHNGSYIKNFPFWLINMVYNPWRNLMWIFCKANTSNKFDNMLIVSPENIDDNFEKWTKVPGNNDWCLPSEGMYVRPLSNDSKSNYISITATEPNLEMNPLIYLMFGAKDTVVINNYPVSSSKILVGNDTLELINMDELPLSVRGRNIISIDYQTIRADELSNPL